MINDLSLPSLMPASYPNTRSVGAINSCGKMAPPSFTAAELIPLVNNSMVGDLHGLPFPVQFRNQGVLEDWQKVLQNVRSSGMGLVCATGFQL